MFISVWFYIPPGACTTIFLNVFYKTLEMRKMEKKLTKDIQDYCMKLIEENGKEGFIIGADCTIPSDTPIQNLLWVKEARDRYNERSGWKKI